MPRKREPKFPPDADVKSTIELVDEYVVVSSRAEPEIQEQAEATNRKWRESHHGKIAAIKEIAAGRKIVRESRFRRPCFWHGVVVRETGSFYFYEAIPHGSNEPIELFGEYRISKSKVHLEPCENCADHPQARNPQGWIG